MAFTKLLGRKCINCGLGAIDFNINRHNNETYLKAWYRMMFVDEPYAKANQAKLEIYYRVTKVRDIIDSYCLALSNYSDTWLSEIRTLASNNPELAERIKDIKLSDSDFDEWQSKRVLAYMYEIIGSYLKKDCKLMEKLLKKGLTAGSSSKVYTVGLDPEKVSEDDKLCTFSLPAGPTFSCPGATDICRSCYAQKGTYMAPGGLALGVFNWIYVNQILDDPERTPADNIKECAKELINLVNTSGSVNPSDKATKLFGKAKHRKIFRIHSSGDFFRPDYVEVWYNVVKTLKDVSFWTYTRSFSKEFIEPMKKLVSLPNFKLWASADAINMEDAKNFILNFDGKVGLAIGPVSNDFPIMDWKKVGENLKLPKINPIACPADAYKILESKGIKLRLHKLALEAFKSKSSQSYEKLSEGWFRLLKYIDNLNEIDNEENEIILSRIKELLGDRVKPEVYIAEREKIIEFVRFSKNIEPYDAMGKLVAKNGIIGGSIKRPYSSIIELAILNSAINDPSELSYVNNPTKGACYECQKCIVGSNKNLAILFYAKPETIGAEIEETSVQFEKKLVPSYKLSVLKGINNSCTNRSIPWLLESPKVPSEDWLP